MNSDVIPGTPVQLEHAGCPLNCADADDEFIIRGRDRLHHLKGEFNVVRCTVCGLMRTNPRPTPGTIHYYYPSDYSPHHTPATPTLTLRDYVAARAHRVLNAWRIPRLPPGRLLEFGCGTGSYLKWMTHQGWQVAGIESSPRAAEKSRALGVPVRVGRLEEISSPADPVDLCAGWMVLEHLHDPVRALTKLASWTRPGGWLAVSMPNAASAEARRFGDSWFALELPRHLYHFTPETIAAVLSRSGWQLREIHHQRNVDNFVASLGYVLEKTSGKKIVKWLARQLIQFPTNVPIHFLTYPILFPVACALAAAGQTGRMTILAQKQA